MERLSFILLLALSAIQCGAAVESSSSRLLRKTTTTSRPKSLDFGAITSQQQPQKNHRELSSSSSSSGGTWFAWLWYNTLTHLCPPHHQGCPHPCPPGQPNCHHSSSSSGGSSGGDGTANSSGGSSSGGSSGGTSYSNNGDGEYSNGDGEYSNNDGWSADGHDSNYSGDVDYTNEDGSTWSDDGWNSSNLDNGNANGSTFEVNAQSIVPFLVGALVAGVIGAAFVVSRVSNIYIWQVLYEAFPQSFLNCVDQLFLIIHLSMYSSNRTDAKQKKKPIPSKDLSRNVWNYSLEGYFERRRECSMMKLGRMAKQDLQPLLK